MRILTVVYIFIFGFFHDKGYPHLHIVIITHKNNNSNLLLNGFLDYYNFTIKMAFLLILAALKFVFLEVLFFKTKPN